MTSRCFHPRCRAVLIEIVYFGRDLCLRCWTMICALDDYFKIAKLLKLRRRCVVTESGIRLREASSVKSEAGGG